jgi:hypothetical protein
MRTLYNFCPRERLTVFRDGDDITFSFPNCFGIIPVYQSHCDQEFESFSFLVIQPLYNGTIQELFLKA